ncbi:MAG: hypothetical protein CL666_06345 [Balneola sp.]|nr:hypothetical protein [Balneola sp.]|tara:strand:+ start:30513 stop:31385 length:873 start_codon:yes stop_codon:yes gene_type:complete
MKSVKKIYILTGMVAFFAFIATLMGIFSLGGSGGFEYESIRGQTVEIYGKGLYQHMSAEVAIQGIAQDYITLFIGIPLLLISLFYASKGSLRARFALAGTLGYFFVTYLFYLAMAMYNSLFLIYIILAGSSFFAFSLTVLSLYKESDPSLFSENAPAKLSGWFLMISSLSIALLWLSVVVPPLLDGSIYPSAVEHYTTLIVQGLDLSILLPLAFVSGYLLLKKEPGGYLLAPIYLIFLSILMAALIAKIVYMGLVGYNIIPVIFIIPVIEIIAITCSVLMLKSIQANVPA